MAQHLVGADRCECECEADLDAQEVGQAPARRRVRDERGEQHAERQRVERERLGALGRARAPGQRGGLPGDEQGEREGDPARRQPHGPGTAQRVEDEREEGHADDRVERQEQVRVLAADVHRKAERRGDAGGERERERPALQRAGSGDAEREREHEADRRDRGVGAQRVHDAEPAEQRQRAAGGEQERREPRRAIGARQQAGEAGRGDEREGRRDHEPSPGTMPASVVTSSAPAISATRAVPRRRDDHRVAGEGAVGGVAPRERVEADAERVELALVGRASLGIGRRPTRSATRARRAPRTARSAVDVRPACRLLTT